MKVKIESYYGDEEHFKCEAIEDSKAECVDNFGDEFIVDMTEEEYASIKKAMKGGWEARQKLQKLYDEKRQGHEARLRKGNKVWVKGKRGKYKAIVINSNLDIYGYVRGYGVLVRLVGKGFEKRGSEGLKVTVTEHHITNREK